MAFETDHAIHSLNDSL